MVKKPRSANGGGDLPLTQVGGKEVVLHLDPAQLKLTGVFPSTSLAVLSSTRAEQQGNRVCYREEQQQGIQHLLGCIR